MAINSFTPNDSSFKADAGPDAIEPVNETGPFTVKRGGRKRARNYGGQYFWISLQACERIARRRDPRLVIAYWVLCSFTSMKDENGMGANRVTGASGGAITRALGCRHVTAVTLLGELAKLGIISNAPHGVRAGRMKQARWVMEFAGDVAMPHALIYGLPGVTGIKERLLKKGDSAESKSFALVLLAHFYARHDLEKFGGVDPSLMSRLWKTVPRAYRSAFKINGEPADSARVTVEFMTRLLWVIGVTTLDATAKQIFWDAFNMLKSSRLLYEVVTLFDSERLVVPIRINDHHAAATEPALLASEGMTGFGFYDRPGNDRNEPEGCWFAYPDYSTRLKLIGVWRLRFRCATPATALGLRRDGQAVATVVQKLVEDP